MWQVQFKNCSSHRPIYLLKRRQSRLAELRSCEMLWSCSHLYICSYTCAAIDWPRLTSIHCKRPRGSWSSKRTQAVSMLLGYLAESKVDVITNCTIAIAMCSRTGSNSSLSVVSCCSAAIQSQELKAEHHSLTVHFRNNTWQNRWNIWTRTGPR